MLASWHAQNLLIQTSCPSSTLQPPFCSAVGPFFLFLYPLAACPLPFFPVPLFSVLPPPISHTFVFSSAFLAQPNPLPAWPGSALILPHTASASCQAHTPPNF